MKFPRETLNPTTTPERNKFHKTSLCAAVALTGLSGAAGVYTGSAPSQPENNPAVVSGRPQNMLLNPLRSGNGPYLGGPPQYSNNDIPGNTDRGPASP